MKRPRKTAQRARSLKSAPVAAPPTTPPPSSTPRRLLSLLSSTDRKSYPMASGLMDYFPDALASVANISWLGNNKHNPGEDLHWARGKSMDHADCILRHHAERGALDNEGVRHSAQMAWREIGRAHV